MAPLRTASVRHRPSIRLRSRRLSSVRDNHLDPVGVRYEQTKQAQPPILLPPLPPRCVSIRPRASTTPTVAVRPAIPPPPEDHPLFRLEPHLRPNPPAVSIVGDVESKRDSCAPTLVSVTLRGDSERDGSLPDSKRIGKALDSPCSEFTTDVKEGDDDDKGVHKPEIETSGIVAEVCIPFATARALALSPAPAPLRSLKRASRLIVGTTTISIRATVRSMMETGRIRRRKRALGSLGSVGGEDDRDQVAFPEADGSSRESTGSSSTFPPGSTPYARASASASTAAKAAMRGSLGSSKSPKTLQSPPRLQHGSAGSSTGNSLAVTTVGASRPGKGPPGHTSQQPSQALGIASTGSSSSSPAPTSLGADNVHGPFSPINTLISQDRLAVDFGNLSFSSRGSIMFGGQAPVDNSTQRDDELADAAAAQRQAAPQGTDGPTPPTPPASTAHVAAAAVEAATPTTPSPPPQAEPPLAAVAAAPAAPADLDHHHETDTQGERETETASSKSSRLSDASGLTRPSIAINEDPTSPSAPLPSIRVMPMDVERESQKVRSLYESSDGWLDGGRRVSFAGDLRPLPSEVDPSDVVYGFPFEPRHRPHHALLTRTSS